MHSVASCIISHFTVNDRIRYRARPGLKYTKSKLNHMNEKITTKTKNFNVSVFVRCAGTTHLSTDSKHYLSVRELIMSNWTLIRFWVSSAQANVSFSSLIVIDRLHVPSREIGGKEGGGGNIYIDFFSLANESNTLHVDTTVMCTTHTQKKSVFKIHRLFCKTFCQFNVPERPEPIVANKTYFGRELHVFTKMKHFIL